MTRPAWSGFKGAGCNPIVGGRKFCTACGRYRLVLDFPCCRRQPLKLSSWCHTCLARKTREMRRDPVRGPLRREYDRIWHEGKRRAAGVPERNWPNGRGLPREDHQGWTVDPEPLAGVIERWLRSGGTERELERASGVPARRVYQLLHGGRVSVPVADRLAVALGTHLDVIYPQETA